MMKGILGEGCQVGVSEYRDTVSTNSGGMWLPELGSILVEGWVRI